jgi:hypothetical protein
VSLNILIAGCLRDEKDQIESVVKEAIGERQEAGPWNVSLVKLGTSWSIDLDGPDPDLQGISLSATDDNLKETIASAIGRNGSTGAHKSSGGDGPLPNLEDMLADEGLLAQTVGATPEATDNPPGCHECGSCGRSFRVIYEAHFQEPKVKAPVACPHCWQMTDVSIAESAAATQEYRAEVIES